MPTRIRALSKLPPHFTPLHALLADRCPELSATRPSDIDFASGCASMALSVPEKHRQDVLAAFHLGIEAQEKHESEGARRIVIGLHRARQVLERLEYAPRAMGDGNGVDLTRAASFARDDTSVESRAS